MGGPFHANTNWFQYVRMHFLLCFRCCCYYNCWHRWHQVHANSRHSMFVSRRVYACRKVSLLDILGPTAQKKTYRCCHKGSVGLWLSFEATCLRYRVMEANHSVSWGREAPPPVVGVTRSRESWNFQTALATPSALADRTMDRTMHGRSAARFGSRKARRRCRSLSPRRYPWRCGRLCSEGEQKAPNYQLEWPN